MNMKSLIQEASAATPDPGRAFKNLERLWQDAAYLIEDHEGQIGNIAKLFSYSQFLADYSIKSPESLSLALKHVDTPVDKQQIISEAREAYKIRVGSFKKNAMEVLRKIKKDYLLRITLRDLLGMMDLKKCMIELGLLAEAVTETALAMAESLLRERFGFMRENAFSIVGLGKLGAGELNYSSDIDILTLYRFEDRVSTGILTPYGIRTNKIGAQEYFCRLTEALTTLLQSHTEDGIAYRVDLRLRPNGQKGAISLSLDSYRSYYEAWGKTWERVALIRSRPIAGDDKLGTTFLREIEPFVWKKSIDYHDIEEIRELKKKIDSIFEVNDVKRGYGGIREIEFFVHTFQLLYGGENNNLRTGSISEVLDKLLTKGFLPAEDVKTLSGGYLFLRRLEHVLQMRDDMQTHTLPSNPDEISVLARKMHFRDTAEFLSELKLKRLKVRDMYNFLLGGAGETQEVMLSLRDELPEGAIRDYLAFKGFRNTEAALRNLNDLIDQISSGKTTRERALLRKAIPAFLDQIMRSESKDRALSMLVTFIQKTGNHESYIDLLLQREETRESIVGIFSRSTYLTRSLLSIENLEGIFEFPDIRTDYRDLRERFENSLLQSAEPLNAAREFKTAEELKLGMLFLSGFLDTYAFSRQLSLLADVTIGAVVHYLRAEKGFAVIGLGGYGAEDLGIGSDLDLLFITSGKAPALGGGKGVAEALIKFLSEYTSKGFAYKVDMRLRPDGSKGVLTNNVEGYENYYLKSARPWEIQSLLRARPVAGDMRLLEAFEQIKRSTIMIKGVEIKGSDIKDMRERIVHEVSKESMGYDVKKGPGGIKEVEFLTQYLQLKHAKTFPDLIIPDTVSAVKRLTKYGILDVVSEELLLSSHRFLKTIDTLLRFNEVDILRPDSELVDVIARFIGPASRDELIGRIRDTRRKVAERVEGFYKKGHK